jgi:Ca2+-binding EF-hand superfamily protein
MNAPFTRKHALSLAFVPLAVATLLSACAPYEPYGAPVYDSARTSPASAPVALFDRLDANRDGFLSRAEVEPLGLSTVASAPTESPAERFRRLDTNGDGFLSKAEAGTTFDAVPGGSFDAFDTNRDGFINMTEALPHLQWLQGRGAPGALTFDALDADRDGFLNRAEAAPLASMTPRYANVPAPAWTFERLDGDRDGYLTRAEAAVIANPRTFDAYDTNRDGFLSRAEADPLLRSGVGGTFGSPASSVYGPR